MSSTRPRHSGKSRQLTWLFDLDNTLHDASHAIFPAINANMNAYMARVLGDGETPADAAIVNAVRISYWKRYGATLLGMIRHHNVHAADFLHHAHQFDDLPAMIRAERGLGRILQRLPGRKILLTNAPRRYAHAVVRHLGLHRHFASHLPIESMMVHRQLRPKPSKALLRKIMRHEKLTARNTVLVEDTIVNLKSARALGLRTVWVTQYVMSNPVVSAAARAAGRKPPPWSAPVKRPGYVDVKVQSLGQLPGQLHRLRQPFQP
ncbi:pyrimidine 5'-nucleotidase [Lacisediminimonas sp.]|uniref:pyrimidine 5'-nucleotidase n=1 Tax=Lacisediminimonas sp. TaxID=3060582 RepID=UPI002721D686|nr:pyrimidine 5'-nucleotidase [Lacisediminimonas sp.]MDO8299369.1 pyrimidine 5'-nucleotidase [Lacisediminimonas sp.]